MEESKKTEEYVRPGIYMAPLEGITTQVYRRVSSDFFSAPDKYFTPYLSPAEGQLFNVREWEEIAPLANDVTRVVPQLMVNRGDLCLAAIRELEALGYGEVNLNMGCPSGNVVRKNKGSGMLRDLSALHRFLEEVMDRSPLPVSVKTRIGIKSAEEFPEILGVLKQYPFSEMILHPRVRDQFYEGEIHGEEFVRAKESCPFPVVYNGDIRTREQIRNHSDGKLMIGRGLIAGPDLLEEQEVGEERILEFLRTLEEEYLRVLTGEGAVLVRMKRIWNYRLDVLPCRREGKIRIMQAQTLHELHQRLREEGSLW